MLTFFCRGIQVLWWWRLLHEAANSANLVHGRSPLSEITNTTSFWHIDAAGGRPHQQCRLFSIAQWLRMTGPRRCASMTSEVM